MRALSLQNSTVLSDRQFARLRRLALLLAGIDLVERHREILHRRSRRLGLRDEAELDALIGAVEAGEAPATQKLFSLLTTKFTGFFRHPRHFDLAAQHVLRVSGQRSGAQIWSAGTATGEEAWSLAMAVNEAFRNDSPPVRILATDLDVEALAVAARAEYAAAAMQKLESDRHRFLVESNAPQRWRIAPAVRALVQFRQLNLIASDWDIGGPFDVIFCRNVLMYLTASHRHTVLERLTSVLAPDGLLMLDPTEHPGKAARWFTPGAAGVYSLRHLPDSVKTTPADSTRIYS